VLVMASADTASADTCSATAKEVASGPPYAEYDLINECGGTAVFHWKRTNKEGHTETGTWRAEKCNTTHHQYFPGKYEFEVEFPYGGTNERCLSKEDASKRDDEPHSSPSRTKNPKPSQPASAPNAKMKVIFAKGDPITYTVSSTKDALVVTDFGGPPPNCPPVRYSCGLNTWLINSDSTCGEVTSTIQCRYSQKMNVYRIEWSASLRHPLMMAADYSKGGGHLTIVMSQDSCKVTDGSSSFHALAHNHNTRQLVLKVNRHDKVVSGTCHQN
jgi:hypothetical protein